MHIWKLSDMHFSNYVSLEKATQLVSKGTKKITLTRTAFRQTPAKTLKFLRENGVEINIVERRGRPRKLSKQEIIKILIARKEGLSFYKISKLINQPKSTIFDYYTRYKNIKINEDEIKNIKIKESKKILKKIINGRYPNYIKEIAKKGIDSSDEEQIISILEELISYIN